MKTIAVFGSSGSIGLKIVRIAEDAGFNVIAISRRQQLDLPPATRNLVGELNDTEMMKKVVSEADYIISALDHRRTSRNPWAKQTSPETLLTDFYSKFLPIAKERKQPPKIVHISAAGVGHDWSRLPAWYRFFVTSSNIQLAYGDHANALKLLSTYPNNLVSVVKPVILNDRTSLTAAQSITLPFSLVKSAVSREAVARFIISQIEQSAIYGHEVTLGQ